MGGKKRKGTVENKERALYYCARRGQAPAQDWGADTRSVEIEAKYSGIRAGATVLVR